MWTVFMQKEEEYVNEKENTSTCHGMHHGVAKWEWIVLWEFVYIRSDSSKDSDGL